MDVSYTELKSKEVINLTSGARMGKIIDLILDTKSKTVLGLVVPGARKLFQPNEDIFIPWKNISKIGTDTILVNIDCNNLTNITKTKESHNSKECKCENEDYLC